MSLNGFFDVQASPNGWFSELAQADGWFNVVTINDNNFRQWLVANKNGIPMDNIAFIGVVAIDSIVRVNGILL